VPVGAEGEIEQMFDVRCGDGGDGGERDQFCVGSCPCRVGRSLPEWMRAFSVLKMNVKQIRMAVR
jgi:hypothetical protein